MTFQDGFGLTITGSGGGLSPWVLVRSDGLEVSYDGSLSSDAVQAMAISTFNAMAPPTYSPSPEPDPDRFGAAVMADAAITPTVRLMVGNWIPSLTLAIKAENEVLIATTWELLISGYSISDADRAAVVAHATTYSIPGIT